MDTWDSPVWRPVFALVDVLKMVVVAVALLVIDAIKACLPASLLDKKSIAQEVILVTGAGSGIGRLLAQRLAALGGRLVLWDVNQEANEQTACLIRQNYGEAHSYTCDLADKDDIYRVADLVKKEVGEVDILINNAGIVNGKRFLDSSDDALFRTIEINLLSHFWTLKSFLPSMQRRNHGHVVAMASAGGLFGSPSLLDYCASKFAVAGFMESLGLDLDTNGFPDVHSTTVCSFYVDTGMFDGVETRFPSVLPILEPEYAVQKIVDAILTNQKLLLMPRFLYFLLFVKSVVSLRVGYYLCHWFGATHAMDHFKGRPPVAVTNNNYSEQQLKHSD